MDPARSGRRWLLVTALAMVVLSGFLVTHAHASTRTSRPGTAQVASMLRGVPQHGSWLGRKSAPLTLVEYVDLQCPYCARFSREIFPAVIRKYVRTGRVRVLFRGLAFVGPDSVTGLRWVVAAGYQNRLWNVLELLYASQGQENSGWITTERLTATARSVAGLKLQALRRDSGSAKVMTRMAAMAAAARVAAVPGTPYFQTGRTLRSLSPLKLESWNPREFESKLDTLLR